MSSETAAMNGILNVVEAAEILGVKPIEVKRLIALRRLADNRNRRGSVILRDDLHRYLGAGSLDLRSMPELDPTQSWFLGADEQVSINQYFSAMRAAADGLAPIPDARLQTDSAADRTRRIFTYDVPATVAMRAAFAAPFNSLLSNFREYAKATDGKPFGMIATLGAIRAAAWSAIDSRQAPERDQVSAMTSPLMQLYSSPENFSQIVSRATAAATDRLAVEIRESRVVAGRENAVSVVRRVQVTSIDPSFQTTLSAVLAIAF